MKYPNVNTLVFVDDIPVNPPTPEWKYGGAHRQFELQAVAHLAVDFARGWSSMTIMADAMADAHSDDGPRRRTWNYEELARNSCDAATALYLEFQDRGWMIEIPPPARRVKT
jgi:hypothetical protein